MSVIAIIRAIILRLWPLLLLILALWLVYFIFFRKKARDEKLPVWQARLWLGTFAAAIFLILVSIVAMVMEFDDNADQKYVPAHMENGEFVPGKMIDENGVPKE